MADVHGTGSAGDAPNQPDNAAAAAASDTTTSWEYVDDGTQSFYGGYNWSNQDWWRNWNGNWGNWGYGQWGGGDSYGGQSYDRPRDDDPPEWDGTSTPMLSYFRSIRIWEAGTKMELERRGVKLLGKLTGDAFSKTEMIDPMTLKRPDSVEVFMEHIQRLYQPIENHHVGQVMDYFMD